MVVHVSCGTVCGNNQCEFGEACVDEACSTGCRTDCPIPLVSCPQGTNRLGIQSPCSGSGSCSSASESCLCFQGYAGNDCSQCAPYYLRIGTSCVFMPGAFASCTNGVKDGNEDGVDCGGPNCNPCAIHESATEALLSTDTVVKIGVVGGAAMFVGVIAGFVYCQRRPKESDKLGLPIPLGMKGGFVQRSNGAISGRSQVMPVSACTRNGGHAGLSPRTKQGIQIPTSPIQTQHGGRDGTWNGTETPVESWRGPSPVRKQRVETVRAEQKAKSVQKKTTAWQN
jgi:hypothetical protein